MEELLYFLQIFVHGFNTTQAHYFLKLTFKLIELQKLEDEEYDLEFSEKINKGFEVNQLRNNFIVYCHNPLIVCIMIMDLSKTIQKRFPYIERGTNMVISKFSKLFSII
jgi:hypothetical protein